MWYMWTLKHNEQCCKKFWHSRNKVKPYLIILIIQTTLFSDSNLVKFLNILANISFFPCMLLLNVENNIVYNIAVDP